MLLTCRRIVNNGTHPIPRPGDAVSYPPQPPPYQPGPSQPGPDHRYAAPGWPPQPMPPAKKKRGPLAWILVAFGVVAALCVVIGLANVLGGDGGGTENTAGPGAQGAAPEKATAGRKIVMEVTGAKKADITYGLDADQSQDQGAKVPWKKELTSTETMTIAVIVAQNKGSGTISCKISLDGKVVKENSSKGEYAVVTCEASEFGF
jgi:hypothetical protein